MQNIEDLYQTFVPGQFSAKLAGVMISRMDWTVERTHGIYSEGYIGLQMRVYIYVVYLV